VKYIENGYVHVDGAIVDEPGFHVQDEQVIELASQAQLEAPVDVTFLFNKPAGYDVESRFKSGLPIIQSDNHAVDDRSPNRFIKRHLKELKLSAPLGRLSGGLVVLTQDWRIARKLKDDANKIEQEYIITVSGEMLPDGLKLLNTAAANMSSHVSIKASWQSENKLRFAIKGVKRNDIASMCAKVGLSVVEMKRIRLGRIPLSTIAEGKWRFLLNQEQF